MQTVAVSGLVMLIYLKFKDKMCAKNKQATRSGSMCKTSLDQCTSYVTCNQITPFPFAV